MIVIKAYSIEEAHTKVIKALLNNGSISYDPELIAEDSFEIELFNPCNSTIPWRSQISDIIKYLSHLPDKEKLANQIQSHYSERITYEDLQNLITLLRNKPFSKRAVLSQFLLGLNLEPYKLS